VIENRAKKVYEIMERLLYDEGEPAEDAIYVQGILHRYGFHPGRLAEAIPEIELLLQGLPKEFYEKGGGGWSFLNLCNDADGNQWGEHPDMEALCCLAIGAGLGKWVMKEMAEVLPGGMPFFVIHGEVR